MTSTTISTSSRAATAAATRVAVRQGRAEESTATNVCSTAASFRRDCAPSFLRDPGVPREADRSHRADGAERDQDDLPRARPLDRQRRERDEEREVADHEARQARERE